MDSPAPRTTMTTAARAAGVKTTTIFAAHDAAAATNAPLRTRLHDCTTVASRIIAHQMDFAMKGSASQRGLSAYLVMALDGVATVLTRFAHLTSAAMAFANASALKGVRAHRRQTLITTAATTTTVVTATARLVTCATR